MPRYLFETTATSQRDRDAMFRLAAERFPEIEFEQHLSVRGEAEDREIWVCRATSDTHVRRFVEASGAVLHAVRPIQTETLIG
jgi:hypothetical protein